MNVAKSFWSILVPWHNEWLPILLYLGFGINFLVQTFLIMAKSPQFYKLRYQNDYDYIFIATFGMATSLLLTAAYLIFYSMSKAWLKFFDMLDFMGKIIMVYFYSFAFFASELVGNEVYYPFLFLLTSFLIASLILCQYELGRIIAFWGTVALLSILFFYDFIFASTPKQKEVFYIPIFVELIIVGCGYLLYYFSLPERWCKKIKFFQLYTTGFIFFTAFLINFYFEA